MSHGKQPKLSASQGNTCMTRGHSLVMTVPGSARHTVMR
jgi:hypothetical protein